MRRGLGRAAIVAGVTICLLAGAWWVVLWVRLRDGVAEWIAHPPPGVTVLAPVPAFAWATSPSVDLGTVALTLSGQTLRLVSARAALSPLKPGTLVLTAGPLDATGVGAASLRTSIRLDGSGADATIHGIQTPGSSVDAVLATSPVANGYAWTVDVSGEHGAAAGDAAGLHATGTAEPGLLRVGEATLDRVHGASLEGQFAVGLGGPDGSGTLHAQDLAAAKDALNALFAPGARQQKTLGALLDTASAFSVRDFTIPWMLKGHVVSVLGVPVARLDRPPMSPAATHAPAPDPSGSHAPE